MAPVRLYGQTVAWLMSERGVCAAECDDKGEQ